MMVAAGLGVLRETAGETRFVVIVKQLTLRVNMWVEGFVAPMVTMTMLALLMTTEALLRVIR